MQWIPGLLSPSPQSEGLGTRLAGIVMSMRIVVATT